MKRSIVLTLFIFFSTVLLVGAQTFADSNSLPANEYFVGRIIAIEKGRQEEMLGATQQFLNIKVQITGGVEKGKQITIEDEDRFNGEPNAGPQVGEVITVVKVWDSATVFTYHVDDRYRLPALGWIFILFLVLVIFFGRGRGLGSILGLGVSVLILVYYIIPRLLAGANPIPVTIIGSFLIAICSILLAHGFKRRTFIALGSTLITLALSVLLADFFVHAAALFGMGSEEAFYLQVSGAATFDLRGLLLGGIIIGMLGILDDVTTAQSATVEEIKKANPELSFRDLYHRGLSVGKEHIASLVNTLVLAYVGTSLPLFLLFTLNQNQQPAWVLLNSEFVSEEIIRALAGSVTLVLAVPITTFLAARFFARSKRGGL